MVSTENCREKYKNQIRVNLIQIEYAFIKS